MKRDENLKKLLLEHLDLLIKSKETLNLSAEKCKMIGFKQNYSFEESESFDSLTSKFSRTSDIYTQKLLRTIWLLLHEESLPFIDFLNQAEKISLIKSADEVIICRDLRNDIAHDYIQDNLMETVNEVMNYIPVLNSNICKTVEFVTSRNWI